MRPKRYDTKVYIYGKHALLEALMNAPKVIRKVYLAPDLRDTDMRILLKKHNIPSVSLAKNKGIKKSQAYAELLKLNPAAYDAYINERDQAITNPMLREKYMSQVRQRLTAPIR